MDVNEGEDEEEEDDTTPQVQVEDTPRNDQTDSHGAAAMAISKPDTTEDTTTANFTTIISGEHQFTRTRPHVPFKDAGAIGFDPETSRGRAPESSTAVPQKDVVRPTDLNLEEQDLEFHQFLADSNNSNDGAQTVQLPAVQQSYSLGSWWDKDEGECSAAPAGIQLPRKEHKRQTKKKKTKARAEHTAVDENAAVGEENTADTEMLVLRTYGGQILGSQDKAQICRDLQDICAEYMSSLGDTKQVVIRRTSVLEDGMELYEDHKTLLYDLVVTFDGEEGIDIDGLKREFFLLMEQGFLEKYCHGNTLKVTDMRAALLDDVERDFPRMGRAITHRFILTGEIPREFPPSLLIAAFTNGEPSSARLVLDLLQVISLKDRTIIGGCLSQIGTLNQFSDEALKVFTQFGIHATPGNVANAVRKIAKTVLLVTPAYGIKLLRSAFTTLSGTPWSRLTDRHIEYLHEQQKPTPGKVARIIVADLDPVACSQDKVAYFERREKEKQVLRRLKEIVSNFNLVLLKQFLRFVTGSDNMPIDIKVSFIHEQNGRHRPFARTCSRRLELSVNYENKMVLQLELEGIIQDQTSFIFSGS